MCIRDSCKFGSKCIHENEPNCAIKEAVTNGEISKERYDSYIPVSYTHLRAHETPEHLVCRLLLEKKKNDNVYRAFTF
ncbi:Putative ribosome biogenesis GTPase RsgA [Clostridioides difficile]|nr:Putative ribosome biogenesis GTPase RsgA [Clostridioides difficile]